MDKTDLILKYLTLLYNSELKEKDFFKARAYNKVIKGIKALKKPIHSFDDIKDLPGIGKKIQGKIEEIISTGRLAGVGSSADSEAARKAAESKAITELSGVYGIGPTKALDLIAKGIMGVEDLKKPENAGVLNEKQKIGLKYYSEFLERIPREEMKKHDLYLKRVIKSVNKESNVVVDIVGSYRRKLETSGDIDVLICFPNESLEVQQELFTKIITKMRKNGYITDILAQGKHKCLAVCVLKKDVAVKHRRIDILLTPKDEYPYSLLYFTGSEAFNIQCRIKAKEKGYSLNEHGLYKNGEKDGEINFQSEKDILKFLGMKYVSPKLR